MNNNKHRLLLILFQFALIVLFNSCTNNTIKTNTIDSSLHILNKRDSKLDSLFEQEYIKSEIKVLNFLNNKQLSFYNDTGRWYMYNIYCNSPLPDTLQQDTAAKIYLSYLPLKPLSCYIHGNVLEIYYSFIYKKSRRVDSFIPDKNFHIIVEGVRFNLKTKKIINYINGNGSYKELGTKSRFINLIQPEIIPFVNSNKDKLDPWYKEALIKHGMIKPPTGASIKR